MAAVLSLAHATLRLSVMTRFLRWLWMPVPLAVLLGIMKVCSIPSQKSIFVCLVLASCSLVATAMQELIPAFVVQTLLQGAGHTALRPLLYPCVAVS